MQERLYLPKENRIETLSEELYIQIQNELQLHYEQNSTYKDESLLDAIDVATLDVVIRKVATVFASETPIHLRQAIAYEAFHFALKISSVLNGKLNFKPDMYYAAANSELIEKMSKDYHDYTEQHKAIRTLIDERLCNIDQFGNDFVMAETFAGVVIMQLEAQCAKTYVETKFGEIVLNFANKTA